VPTTRNRAVAGPEAFSFPLDATLEVPGVPQSGTGQAALLTGVNAARLNGGHFGPWIPVGLRPLVEERSLLRLAKDAGRATVFANAYPKHWPGPRGSRRVAGPPLAARGAGLLDRHEEALGEGRAVSSEIVNEGWRHHLGHDWLPSITEAEAGRNLAAIASSADLTLFAHYDTDRAGHREDLAGAAASLERVDRFLSGIVDSLPDDVTVVLASDHGNVEDVTAEHTRNPALGLALGPHARELADTARSILDITPFLARHLGVNA